jgi:hypothetical protein
MPNVGSTNCSPLPRRGIIAECLKLMEKWGFGLSKKKKKKKFVETFGRYVNENKIPTPFRGGVPVDFFHPLQKNA